MAQFIDLPIVASDGSPLAITETVNVSTINRMRPATTKEIAAAPGANGVTTLFLTVQQGNSVRPRTYLSTLTVAQIKTLAAA